MNRDEAYIDSAAALQGLVIEPDWREGVLEHFKAIAAAAALVLEFPLEDEAEAAPVFEA